MSSGARSAREPPRGLYSINHYDGHRVVCTSDEKKTASMISGHTWNILNNSSAHEVYLPHARNDFHFIDKDGRHTSAWIHKKGRCDNDGDNIPDCVDSTNVQEAMVRPASVGKEAARLRARQAKQLCQIVAPRDYARYGEIRNTTSLPVTPGKPGNLERQVPFQKRLRDVPPKPTQRVVERSLWTPRRGEPIPQRAPPPEIEMFSHVDQLRTESHIDTTDQQFAGALSSARREAKEMTGSSLVGYAATTRSRMPDNYQHLPGKSGQDRTCHSKNRIEPSQVREISSWSHLDGKDTLKKEDAYFVKPVQCTGSSSVKFDIITGDRKHFWY